MSHSARKAAFSAIGETCPYVDEAFSRMTSDLEDILGVDLSNKICEDTIYLCIDRVKKQTTALRDALILAYEEKEESENELEDQIYSLRLRIEELENQIET